MGMKAAASIDQVALIAQMLINQTIVDMSEEISQAVILQTNASGIVSWTYPRPFSVPPVLSVDVLVAGTSQPFAVRELTRTNTSCSYLVLSSAAIAVGLIGLTILQALAAVGAGHNVHLVAKRATPTP